MHCCQTSGTIQTSGRYYGTSTMLVDQQVSTGGHCYRAGVRKAVYSPPYTAAICHGPFAFLSTKYASNIPQFAYSGVKIMPWSDQEGFSRDVETWHMPKVESTLAAEGAIMVTGPVQKVGYITVD